jgi:hypothetical protein
VDLPATRGFLSDQNPGRKFPGFFYFAQQEGTVKLKQISIPLENSRNRIQDIAKALTDRGIHLAALNLVDTGNLGELRILVSDVRGARQVLLQNQIPGRVEEVVAAEIVNDPGIMTRMLDCLAAADVQIRYAYTLSDSSLEKTTIIFRFNDNDAAIQALTHNNVRILDSAALAQHKVTYPNAA